jgi:hypothetical protein
MLLHNTHTQKEEKVVKSGFFPRGSKRRDKRELKVTDGGRRKSWEAEKGRKVFRETSQKKDLRLTVLV